MRPYDAGRASGLGARAASEELTSGASEDWERWEVSWPGGAVRGELPCWLLEMRVTPLGAELCSQEVSPPVLSGFGSG